MLQGYDKITVVVTSGLNSVLEHLSIDNINNMLGVMGCKNRCLFRYFQSDKLENILKICHFEPFKRVTAY